MRPLKQKVVPSYTNRSIIPPFHRSGWGGIRISAVKSARTPQMVWNDINRTLTVHFAVEPFPGSLAQVFADDGVHVPLSAQPICSI